MKVYTKEQLSQYDLSLTYDDISLIPTEISDVISRRDIFTKTNFLGLELGLPVISSPMDTVTGIKMALELDKLGCLGIVNRFDLSINELINNTDVNGIKAVAIGLNIDEELLEKFAERNLILCLDIANANNVRVLEQCEEIKKKYKVKMIVGNVAHGSTLKQLVDVGADAVRVGIGGGSMCTTSIQTGIGIGQVSSLVSVLLERERKNLKIEIVADGGIKGPGDIAKSIALGADAIMLGRLLAGTKETPGE
ncbi:MAG: IMP dehydrogenase, partial [Ignavibacteriales bacterium]|nr:IMP dehydrogenase [Ignavibacteriales bacterium]